MKFNKFYILTNYDLMYKALRSLQLQLNHYSQSILTRSLPSLPVILLLMPRMICREQ